MNLYGVIPCLIGTKHFRKSKTLPGIRNTFQNPKTLPRIQNTSQNSKTLPRIQNTSQNSKTLPMQNQRVFWILGSVLSLRAIVE